jgi:hypothetical protein
MRTTWQWAGALALWSYVVLLAALALPSVLSRATLWEFSLAALVIGGTPTLALGLFLLVPRIAWAVAILAVVWMAFLAWSWFSSGVWPLGILSLAVAVLMAFVAAIGIRTGR